MMAKRSARLLAAAGALAPALLALATWLSLAPLPAALDPPPGAIVRARVLDRHGKGLSRTYENAFNVNDRVALHEVPSLLRDALLAAEDRRFFEHGGADWRARGAALVQNLGALSTVRGASTISEQVVRMLYPRPRSLWSRWLEGFDAGRLERRFGKAAILEFYLNQVPYSGRWRGVVQAARGYFDRDLGTLDAKEQLALAVLVRSPNDLDPRRPNPRLAAAVERLAVRLAAAGRIDARELEALERAPLSPREPRRPVEAPHFVRHVRERAGAPSATVRTTLDAALQARVQALLDAQVERLAAQDVSDGACLVLDHEHDEILAWANAGGFTEEEAGSHIDAVLAARQPGSTLKPLLYALALDRGFTAGTLVDDSPLAQAVGSGLHRYRNYSRTYHGELRLREALGNSLNIPAVRVVQAVTPAAFLAKLRELGFDSLAGSPDFYGEGLALGNGEVTLYELVAAYAALARGGLFRTSREIVEPALPVRPARRVFSEEAASLVADILADPDARRLEFGSGGLLEFPAPTAVKTGTSSAYRDAWAVGFSHRHTVGVWMGNLDRREMDGVSGSIGPALVLRAVFAELARKSEARPLYLSRKLRRVPICRVSGAAVTAGCPRVEEWFRERDLPLAPCPLHGAGEVARRAPSRQVKLIEPRPGLHLALDPRIPDELEAFAFEIETASPPAAVDWLVDGTLAGRTGRGERRFVWPLSRGPHVAQARVSFAGSEATSTEEARFFVK